jgi:hypothetical protein
LESETPIFAVTVVLPTPPLPETTDITRVIKQCFCNLQ